MTIINQAMDNKNSATSLLEPGSSIKPIVDFAPLFKQRKGNYAPGSILKMKILIIYIALAIEEVVLYKITPVRPMEMLQ